MNSCELKRIIPGSILFFIGAYWLIMIAVNGVFLMSAFWYPTLFILGGLYFLTQVYRSRYENKKNSGGEKNRHGEIISGVSLALSANQWSNKKVAIWAIGGFSVMLGLVLIHPFLVWLNSN